MNTYKSGNIIVKFNFIRSDSGRSEYQVMIYLNNDVLEHGDYDCPSNWSDEKIAEDLVGWVVDTHENIFDEVDHNIEKSEHENRYFVEKINQ